jgi:hypothetical protein
MVWRENIDSGYPNFQLDTRCSGSCRSLVYLRIRGPILGQALQHSEENCSIYDSRGSGQRPEFTNDLLASRQSTVRRTRIADSCKAGFVRS